VFVTEPENEEKFCRSRSIGMTLVNLLMIEEDAQNEIQSFHSVNNNISEDRTTVQNALLAYKAKEEELKKQYQLHIIWAGWSKIYADKAEMEIQWLNLHRPLLTVLYRNREERVTNKNRIDLQENGGWRSARNFVLRNTQMTIGDDFYNFLPNLNDRNSLIKSEIQYSFHFSLIPDILYFSIVRGGFLSNDELVKVDDKNSPDSFRQPFSGAENDKSKSGSKYALSLCFRKTALVRKKSSLNLNPAVVDHSNRMLHEQF